MKEKLQEINKPQPAAGEKARRSRTATAVLTSAAILGATSGIEGCATGTMRAGDRYGSVSLNTKTGETEHVALGNNASREFFNIIAAPGEECFSVFADDGMDLAGGNRTKKLEIKCKPQLVRETLTTDTEVPTLFPSGEVAYGAKERTTVTRERAESRTIFEMGGEGATGTFQAFANEGAKGFFQALGTAGAGWAIAWGLRGAEAAKTTVTQQANPNIKGGGARIGDVSADGHFKQVTNVNTDVDTRIGGKGHHKK